jgi:hypothetical protein
MLKCDCCGRLSEVLFNNVCPHCWEIQSFYCSGEILIGQEGGGHNDKDKLRVDLVPTELIEAAARAYGYGAQKYGDLNFRKGIRTTRLLGSVLRHIYKWMDREDKDEESGLDHLDHAVASLGMILWMLKNRPDLDDRHGTKK